MGACAREIWVVHMASVRGQILWNMTIPVSASVALQQELSRYSNLTMREWYRTIYLNSAHWIELRERVKRRRGKRCEKCNRGNVDVHHLNYRNIYDVTEDDLQVLCRRCHNNEHEKPPQVAARTAHKADTGKKKLSKKEKRRQMKAQGIVDKNAPKSWGLEDVTTELKKWKNRGHKELSAISCVLRNSGWLIPDRIRAEMKRRKKTLKLHGSFSNLVQENLSKGPF